MNVNNQDHQNIIKCANELGNSRIMFGKLLFYKPSEVSPSEEKSVEELNKSVISLYSEFDNKDESLSSVDESESKEDDLKESVPQVQHHLPGGHSVCSNEQRDRLKVSISKLMSKGLLTSRPVYNENIKQCMIQVVQGLRYDAVLHFNGHGCYMGIWEKPYGSLEILNNDDQSALGTKSLVSCSELTHKIVSFE